MYENFNPSRPFPSIFNDMNMKFQLLQNGFAIIEQKADWGVL